MRAAKQAKVDAVTAALTGAGAENGYMAPPPTTWSDRLFRRLFPRKARFEMHGSHYSYTYVQSHFDWKDRLRILVTGRLLTIVTVGTAETATLTGSGAVQYVPPPGKEV